MVTLADVARLAGVSKATASRAVNQPGLLASATRQRVEEAAIQLGFVANRTARALASGSTGLVTIVVPTLENSFFTPIIRGAQTSAEAANLHLTISVLATETADGQDRLTRLASQVDGLVLVAPRAPDAFLQNLARNKPLVSVDRTIEGIPSVVADTPAALTELVAALSADGHRRIAYLGGPDGSWLDAKRVQAVRTAACQGCTVDVLGPLPPLFSAGVSAVPELLASGATAAIAYASPVALGVLFELQNRGIPADEQPVMCSADDFAVGPLAGLDITMLQVPASEVGTRAMMSLLEIVNGTTAAGAHHVPVPIKFSRTARRPAA